MSTFKALLATKGEKGTDLAWTEMTEADLMEGMSRCGCRTPPSTTRMGSH